MKVVGKSNFSKLLDDILVADNLSAEEADRLCNVYSNHNTPISMYNYFIESDEYVLYVWKP